MKASEIRELSAAELESKLKELNFSTCVSSLPLISSTTRCASVLLRRTSQE